MINASAETWQQPLPHGITLSCRGTGERGRPVLMFPARFPRSRVHLGRTAGALRPAGNGGYRCVAPNLRGYEHSSAAR
jgi:pimeloyl-ACP methyl ester carboxylesterase